MKFVLTYYTHDVQGMEFFPIVARFIQICRNLTFYLTSVSRIWGNRRQTRDHMHQISLSIGLCLGRQADVQWNKVLEKDINGLVYLVTSSSLADIISMLEFEEEKLCNFMHILLA